MLLLIKDNKMHFTLYTQLSGDLHTQSFAKHSILDFTI